MTKEVKKAILYLRVSTEEQVSNFSLDTQEDICRKEAKRKGYIVVQVFREEGKSAKSIVGRPVLTEVLKYCRKNKKQIDALFVYRLDRLSRQTSDFLSIRKTLIECDVKLISATEPTGTTPTETLLETILASFAQHDNDVRSERTKNGLHARYSSGLLNGKPPLGYILEDGKAVKDPESWDQVKRAWELMATGTKSLREIAILMNTWGLQSTHGKKKHKLRPQTVQRIFRLKFYAGILTSNIYPEEVKGQHLPMITMEQFYKVQEHLDGRCTHKFPTPKRAQPSEEFPLRRVVKCSKCNIGLTAGWSKGRTARYPYYRCAGDCTTSIPRADLDGAMMQVLKEITPKEECLELFTKYIKDAYEERVANLKTNSKHADEEIQRLTDLRKVLVEKNLLGVYSDEIFKEQNTEIEKKIAKAEVAKADSTLEKYDINKLTNFMKETLSDLGETYKRSGVAQTRALLGSIFPNGLSWSYDGTLNYEISPMYQAIMNFGATGVPFGVMIKNQTKNVST
jgi:DNA invertase Pin-like site-specific DNA recombinase